ncbi:MAG: flagellin FliC [Deltaproteobacteria bacterium]|nr:flagellin FliC [Deltaproteobacteria bacterium]
MAISVLSNPQSVNAQRNLSKTQSMLSQSIGRLSSGQRINSAADDAAGLAISERMKANMRSLQQASRNAQDGISASQIADGAMDQAGGLLTRMRELAMQSANGTLGTSDRTALNSEFQASLNEIVRIGAVTKFNGTSLLDGTFSASLQVGTGTSANDTITMGISTAFTAAGLGVTGAAVDSAANATTALTSIDAAIDTVSAARGSLGAVQNRLNVTVSNLSTAYENTSAANSRIRDVDFAEETAAMTRSQILSQAGVSILSQANQLPSAALSLLGR